ncbi:hypothetical protein LOAG_18493 [Loa loa]|uniref:Uncharacterized protein n=1 Tax=Loa loa TaxID=7209 RepID=A0A1S0UER1_LOALO|nr:hypothetical protein LOAG_18493 [Loa loa]EJD74150.1 hypothetical protein LOAG_18493 [Loa loa]
MVIMMIMLMIMVNDDDDGDNNDMDGTDNNNNNDDNDGNDGSDGKKLIRGKISKVVTELVQLYLFKSLSMRILFQYNKLQPFPYLSIFIQSS